MKNTVIAFLCIILLISVMFGWSSKSNSYPVFFDHNGQMNAAQIKIYGDTVSPNSSTYTIDYTVAGFSGIKDINVTGQLNTATVGSMPIIEIKSYTTTSCTVNILTQNSSVVSILGINVLSGLPLQLAASPSGIILHCHITGY